MPENPASVFLPILYMIMAMGIIAATAGLWVAFNIDKLTDD